MTPALSGRPNPRCQRFSVVAIAGATASLGCLNLGISRGTGVAPGLTSAGAIGLTWMRVRA
jgi:hypothetical protein